MKRITSLFLFTLSISAASSQSISTILSRYNFTQEAITYDTASSGMTIGYYYPPKSIYNNDSTTGTFTWSIVSDPTGDGFIINPSTGLVSIKNAASVTTGIVMLECKIANSTGWELTDFYKITVYNADNGVWDFVPGPSSWDNTKQYWYRRGSKKLRTDIEVHNTGIIIGAYGVGERPKFRKLIIGDYKRFHNVGADDFFIYSIFFSNAIYGEPGYRYNIWDCEVECVSCSNAAIYLKPSEISDLDDLGHVLCNNKATSNIQDEKHSYKVARGATVINNEGGNATRGAGTYDPHVFSLGSNTQIKYNYGFAGGQAALEMFGDSSHSEMNLWKGPSNNGILLNGDHENEIPEHNVIMYDYLTGFTASDFGNIEINGANNVHIEGVTVKDGKNGIYVASHGDAVSRSQKIKIVKSYISGMDEFGILISDDCDSVTIQQSIIDSITRASVRIFGGAGYKLYNNTIRGIIANDGGIDSLVNTIAERVIGTGREKNTLTNLFTSTDSIYADTFYNLGDNAINCIDKGTKIGLLYAGDAPDIGAREKGLVENAVGLPKPENKAGIFQAKAYISNRRLRNDNL